MSGYTRWIILIIWSCEHHVEGYSSVVPACDSDIYCNGSLLHAVQTSGIFKDSKTFVDMSLKASEETILLEYHKLQIQYKDTVPKVKLAEFVDTYFAGPGEEFIPWTPTDLPRM
ncbi:trehalase-like [Mizuhopecten yessoensis]|uniref:trehalase-like n=1 Tax=Mizuhopecten yessoensis TaxID=6573 RepID=UPI000B45C7FB|nr:trehalase-like [Mizuhopecten yessoensis]